MITFESKEYVGAKNRSYWQVLSKYIDVVNGYWVTVVTYKNGTVKIDRIKERK